TYKCTLLTQILNRVHILRGKNRTSFTCFACKSKCQGRCKSKPLHSLKRRRILNDAVSACQAESSGRRGLPAAASPVNVASYSFLVAHLSLNTFVRFSGLP